MAEAFAPLRVFAPVLALGCALFTAAAVVLGVAALRSGDEVLATASGSSLVLPRGGRVAIYATTADGRSPQRYECDVLGGPAALASPSFSGSTTTIGGRTYRKISETSTRTPSGSTVSCRSSDITGLAVVQKTGQTRALMAGLAAFVAVGSGLMSLVGWRLRRARARSGPA